MTGKFGELFLILIIVFILFGAGKLPKVFHELAKSIKFIKRMINKK